MKSRLLTLANILTMFRIILVPLYLYLFAMRTWYGVFLAGIVFGIAAVTDLIDGRIARNRNEVTRLGKFLDPLADKFLVIGVLIQFCLMGLMNAWLVGIIVVRDVWVTSLRIHAIARGKELKTSGNAKLKTTIQIVVISTTIVVFGVRSVVIELLPGYAGQWIELGNYRLFFNVLLLVAVVFTLYSWGRYMLGGETTEAYRKAEER